MPVRAEDVDDDRRAGPHGAVAQATGSHLILFDGVCGLCNGMVRFVLAHDHRHLFDFAPLESRIARRMLERVPSSARHDDTFYVVPHYHSPGSAPLAKSAAAVYVAQHLSAPWRWLALARALPHRVLDWLYDGVARRRYAVFGRYDVCPMPKPEHRARFVDE